MRPIQAPKKYQKAELSTRRAKSPQFDQFANVVAARVAVVADRNPAPAKVPQAMPTMLTTTTSTTMATTVRFLKTTATFSRQRRLLSQRPRLSVSKTHRGQSQPVSSPADSLVRRSNRASLVLQR